MFKSIWKFAKQFNIVQNIFWNMARTKIFLSREADLMDITESNSTYNNISIRQTQVSTDWSKDKQHWENAIAMYVGPDPLENWYNYVCWYENHGHGDPENKFRETLERCLTKYEHNECYNQDIRMVRLWLKYIEMQTNPLHFYQVLYHRCVGRQLACFYIGWATYYESIEAYKEAESVYTLGFQEKAQTYEELHHAYNKFMYNRQQRLLQQQTQQPQQHQVATPTHNHIVQHAYYHEQQHNNNNNTTTTSTVQSSDAVQISYQQQTPAAQQLQTQPQQQHQTNQINHQNVQPHQYHQQQMPPQQQQQIVYHQNYTATNEQFQYPQQQQQQPVHKLKQVNASQTINYNHFNGINNTTAATPAATYETTNTATTNDRVQYQQQQNTVQIHTKEMAVENQIAPIRLPVENFPTYSQNNFETWQPALFLEEPDDPSRRCHYAKQMVYPGNGNEYSPEELRSKRYLMRLDEQKRRREEVAQQKAKEVVVQQEEKNRQFHQLNGTHNNVHHTHYKQYNPENAVRQQSKEQQQHVDDIEEHIQASTIHFYNGSQNKTLKIKFKKDNNNSNESSVNGNNYSAYTIEGIYQQEVNKSNVGTDDDEEKGGLRRTGHNFHPYMIGQTSTPKPIVKRNRTKVKRINKFQAPIFCGSSNSSSQDVIASANGVIENVQNFDNSVHNASFNDNANYSFSSAAALENSNCSITMAVGRLNFRDVTNTGQTNTIADFSTYQENSFFATQHDTEAKERRREKALETIEKHLAKESIDPFSSELCRAFLIKLDFPGTEDTQAHYKIINTPLPKIANTRTVSLPDGVQFNIDKEVGRGSYGSVYKATDANTGDIVALKYQKPPNTWEIYICDQVLRRIKSPNILPGLMDISTAIIAPNASLIGTEFSAFGSLLDINNKIRQNTTKVMHESLVMHFSAQICRIINHLHLNKIIHADIKPDNFLLMCIPSTDLDYPSLRLIDFGCAIDMTLFPEKTKFRKVIQTDGFTCIEMQEGRSWSFETDLFCIAGTVHVMLFGEYMQLQKRSGAWDIKQKLPRYLKKHVWTSFFSDMLNIKNGKLPDLEEMRLIFEEEAAKMDSELQNQIRTLKNILYRR